MYPTATGVRAASVPRVAAGGQGFPTLALAVLITSFFYCLPLGRFSVGVLSSDFRVYDFAMAAFLFFVAPRVVPRFRLLLRDRTSFHYWALLLIGLVWLSLLFTARQGAEVLLPGVVRAARFSLYFTIAGFVMAIVDTPQRYRFLLRVIYLNIAVQAALGFAQGVGLLSSLWPAYWREGYGGLFPSGTLSPHHKHLGVVMLMGIALSISFLRTRGLLFGRPLAVVLATAMVMVPIFSGSRTAWLGYGGLVLGLLWVQRGRAISTLLMALLGMGLVYTLVRDYVEEPIETQIEARVTGRVEVYGWQGVYGDRMSIYRRRLRDIQANPLVLFTGMGFQSELGAHNNYLHVLLELGIVGLFVYLKFLAGVLRTLRRAAQRAVSRLEKTVAQDVWAVFIAILITMLVGETLWAQYSMFTLSGQIMALVGLAASPLNWALEPGEQEA